MNIMIPRGLILLVALLVLTGTHVLTQAAPKFPGHLAYDKLSKYLEENVKTNLIESNMNKLEELQQEMEEANIKTGALSNAVKLLLQMKTIAEDKLCDEESATVMALNVRGALEDKSKPDLSDRRVSQLVLKHLKLIADRCKLGLEERLDEAIKTIPEHDYQLLEKFLSQGFIMEWHKKFQPKPLEGPIGAQMSFDETWTEGPQPKGTNLILGQLFEQAAEDVANYTDSFYKNYSTKPWKRIVPRKLQELAYKYLIGPCKKLVEKTEKPVFKIFYLAGNHIDGFGEQFTKELTKYSTFFQYTLFRYEFCQYKKGKLNGQLSQELYDCVYPNYKLGIYPGKRKQLAVSSSS